MRNHYRRAWRGAIVVVLAACAPPPDDGDRVLPPPGEGMQLSFGPFTVPAGAEVGLCQTLKLPPGAPRVVRRIDAQGSAGVRRLGLFRAAASVPDVVFPCQAPLNLAQWQTLYHGPPAPDGVQLPDEAAVRLAAGTQLMLLAHFANQDAEPTRARAAFNLHARSGAPPSRSAGAMLSRNRHIAVPPRGTQTISQDCFLTDSIHPYAVGGQLGPRGTHFTVELLDSNGFPTGQRLFEQDRWDQAPVAVRPIPLLPILTGIRFTCSFVNDTDRLLTAGPSVIDDEDCGMALWYAPYAEGFPPELGCLTSAIGW